MIGLRTKSGNAYLVLITEQPNCKIMSAKNMQMFITSFLFGRTTQCSQVVCGNDAMFLNHKELQW